MSFRRDLAGSPSEEEMTRLAAAYDAAVSIISLGDPRLVPSAKARRAMLEAMMADARARGFDEDRLTLVGMAAATEHPDEP